MKTLHVCFSKSWGGLEMASVQWAELLNDDSHQSYSIAAPNSPISKKLNEKSLHCLEIDAKKYWSPKASKAIRHFVQQNQIDAVFVQNLRDLWLVTPALWGLPTKLVGFAQMWLEGIRKTGLGHRLMYNRLNHLITLTPRHSRQYLKCVPVPETKVTILPNSIDQARFGPQLRSQEVRRQLGANDQDILIGLVGRIDRQKGQMELLKAFKKALPQLPPAKLVFIGEPTDGPNCSYLNELKQEAATSSLNECVTFAGFRKDVPNVMASLDIFCINSYKEAFGYVVVESLMSGTPVIATDSGGVPDILQDGEYGELVPAQEVEPLSQALIQLANNQSLRDERSKKGRAYAEVEFDLQQNKLKMLKLLSKTEKHSSSTPNTQVTL